MLRQEAHVLKRRTKMRIACTFFLVLVLLTGRGDSAYTQLVDTSNVKALVSEGRYTRSEEESQVLEGLPIRLDHEVALDSNCALP